MNISLRRLMNEATRLVRGGELRAATAAIQAALGGNRAASLDGSAPTLRETIDIPARDLPTDREAPSVPPSPPSPSAGDFVVGRHGEGPGALDFKLYIPPGAGERPLPLVVMLHGCTQHPDDFAAGTAMNEAAQAQGFFVLYPAQSQQANPQRCWNWFKHSHQQRGRGEPAILAAMTREVMAMHAIDPSRVYVAGLSAGGAMAAILGEAYPDLFAAVGVHSGLPAGIAKDLPAALGAMKHGSDFSRPTPTGMPTIVFHGDADGTVHPGNGEQVIAASAGPAAPVHIEQGRAAGGRTYTRRVHRATDGQVLAEHWVVHGAPHAWSGGSATGSYTDASGPDASAEMTRFFLEHPHRTAH